MLGLVSFLVVMVVNGGGELRPEAGSWVSQSQLLMVSGSPLVSEEGTHLCDESDLSSCLCL